MFKTLKNYWGAVSHNCVLKKTWLLPLTQARADGLGPDICSCGQSTETSSELIMSETCCEQKCVRGLHQNTKSSSLKLKIKYYYNEI